MMGTREGMGVMGETIAPWHENPMGGDNVPQPPILKKMAFEQDLVDP